MLNCLVYTALCLLSPQKMAKLTKVVLTSLFRYDGSALCLLSPQKMAKLTKVVLTSLFRYDGFDFFI